MSDPCVCCGGTAAAPHFPGLLRCAACGHVWADMALGAEELQALYAKHYFQGGEYVSYEAEAPALQRNFRTRLQQLRARQPGGRLLEIGCAYGYFLEAASAYYRAFGCDISEHAVGEAARLPGVEARCIDYLDWRFDAPFEVVCLWDTIEHLAAPHQYVRKAYEDLAPGGVLAISTGDIGAWTARLRGPKWRQIHPPTHLHYFTRASLDTLLRGAGFREITFTYPLFWRSADGVAHKVLGGDRPSAAGALYRRLHAAGLLKVAFPFQSFDLMCALAVR